MPKRYCIWTSTYGDGDWNNPGDEVNGYNWWNYSALVPGFKDLLAGSGHESLGDGAVVDHDPPIAGDAILVQFNSGNLAYPGTDDITFSDFYNKTAYSFDGVTHVTFDGEIIIDNSTVYDTQWVGSSTISNTTFAANWGQGGSLQGEGTLTNCQGGVSLIAGTWTVSGGVITLPPGGDLDWHITDGANVALGGFATNVGTLLIDNGAVVANTGSYGSGATVGGSTITINNGAWTAGADFLFDTTVNLNNGNGDNGIGNQPCTFRGTLNINGNAKYWAASTAMGTTKVNQNAEILGIHFDDGSFEIAAAKTVLITNESGAGAFWPLANATVRRGAALTIESTGRNLDAGDLWQLNGYFRLERGATVKTIGALDFNGVAIESPGLVALSTGTFREAR